MGRNKIFNKICGEQMMHKSVIKLAYFRFLTNNAIVKTDKKSDALIFISRDGKTIWYSFILNHELKQYLVAK